MSQLFLDGERLSALQNFRADSFTLTASTALDGADPLLEFLITPSVKGMCAAASWIRANASRYPATSCSERLLGAALRMTSDSSSYLHRARQTLDSGLVLLSADHLVSRPTMRLRARMSSGVVRQHPPIRRAPARSHSRARCANGASSARPTHRLAVAS
jgi:hypothetical protein